MIITATRYGSSSSGGGGGSSTIRYNLISGTAPTYLEDSETGDWELVFLSSCKIKVTTAVSVDVFAVGGGAPGEAGYMSGAQTAHGGKGGKGGARVTSVKTLTANTEYQIDVGVSGQSTYAFEVTAASGGGSAGGEGAYATYPGGGDSGGNGTAGGLAFGRASASTGRTLYEKSFDQDGQDPVVIYFGPGGGGGGAWRSMNSTDASAARGTGAATGGGNGGKPSATTDYSFTAGDPGSANTGAGGGGGGAHLIGYTNVSGAAGGLGGSGIVIIRNHREE